MTRIAPVTQTGSNQQAGGERCIDGGEQARGQHAEPHVAAIDAITIIQITNLTQEIS